MIRPAASVVSLDHELAFTAQINCISKSDRQNPWEKVTHVGGQEGGGWKIIQQQVIAHIESSQWKFHTFVKGKNMWGVVSESRHNNRYLKTEADDEGENNLLSLPECR